MAGILVALLTVAGGTHCVEPGILPGSTGGQALVSGTPSPELVSMNVAQRRAIGSLCSDDAPFCTAWLASPRVAVTAAHCFDEATDLSLIDLELQREDGVRAVLPVVAVEKHPTLDVAIVRLGAPPEPGFEVEPLAWNVEALSVDTEGQSIEAAGGGVGTLPEDGVSFGVFSIVEVEATRVHVDSADGRGLCRGDSGGPFLMDFASAPHLRVIAVESTGAPDCDGPAWGVRTDILGEWLAAAVSRPAVEDSVRCTAEAARCEGGTSWSCRAGWWRTRDCAALGAGCGERGPDLGPGCLPVPCGAIDALGVCAAGKARWCGAGQIDELDCAARGLGCGWDEAVGGNRCIACTACAGECVDHWTDPLHCGACDTQCVVENGSASCVEGRCAVTGCDEGFVQLDGACQPVALSGKGGGCVQAAVPGACGFTLAGIGPSLVVPGFWWLVARTLRRRETRTVRRSRS
jgi:hypothetical protein